MPLPKPLSVQMIAGLRADPLNYESHRKVIAAQNQLIEALQPGDSIAPQHFTLSPSLGSLTKISSVSGTFKRGKFTITIAGTGLAANPTVMLNFPKGLYVTTPFAQVVRNGGTGALGFSYSEVTTGLTITLAGTPVLAETYGFQFAVRD